MKKQIKILASIAFVIGSVLISSAQPGRNYQERREQIKAQKVAFITNKLDLTVEEAEKFWPVYNEFEEKNEKLQKKFIQNRQFVELNMDDLTDEEAIQIADEHIIMAQKQLDLRKKYYIMYKSILPPKKVLLLFKAEKEFQRFLLEKIRAQEKPIRDF
ncbi:MAG: hypothetical protein KAG99_05695 [Bacteroidales bacterium]|nr:hypothetical protein [Bacteroidales bacterium]